MRSIDVSGIVRLEPVVGAVVRRRRGRTALSRDRRICRMPPPAPSSFERFAPYRRAVEIGYFVLVAIVNATSNTITVQMEHARLGTDIQPFEPAIWEWSSTLVILALVPALVMFTRRWPLAWQGLRRTLPLYVAVSVLWSVLHVVGMVALRKLAYAYSGSNYDFGQWPRELLYEYLKDFRTFGGLVITILVWRWLMLRLQGEASVIGTGEEPDPDNGATDHRARGEPVPIRPERFLVRKLGREFLIVAQDIESLQASGNYVNLHVAGRVYPLRSTMSEIEERLDPERFVRVHRSHIVNIAQVASIEPLDSGDARVHLQDGAIVPCSRRYRELLRELALVAG